MQEYDIRFQRGKHKNEEGKEKGEELKAAACSSIQAEANIQLSSPSQAPRERFKMSFGEAIAHTLENKF